MNSNDGAHHSILNRLYLEAANDLFSNQGLRTITHEESITTVNRLCCVSVLRATAEGVLLTSVVNIDRALIKCIHPLSPAPLSLSDLEDWCRELNNQLVGRMKNKLLHYQIAVNLGLPTLLNGSGPGAAADADCTVNEHRFRRGDSFLVLTLSTSVGKDVQFQEQESSGGGEEALTEGCVVLF